MSTESTTTPREGRENHENYYNFSHHSRTANRESCQKHIKVTTILCNDIVEEKKNVARLSYSTEEKKRAYNNIENKRRVK